MNPALNLTNTSRYPAHAVRWLATYALRYVRGVAEREGWREQLDRHPVALAVTNCRYTYRGRSLGVRSRTIDPKNTPAGSVTERRFLVRIGAPTSFPCDSTYSCYKDMPEARLNDWQEAVVGLCAHEFSHTRYTYAGGDRKGAEEACELIELDCVDAFRRDRAHFDAAMQHEAEAEAERELRQAAKSSPEAMLAAEIATARAAVARWQRKQKLAATKLKVWTRRLNRLEKREKWILDERWMQQNQSEQRQRPPSTEPPTAP